MSPGIRVARFQIRSCETKMNKITAIILKEILVAPDSTDIIDRTIYAKAVSVKIPEWLEGIP